MSMEREKLLRRLKNIVAEESGRTSAFQEAADAIRNYGGYRWVGLYIVDHAGGLVKNSVWSGAGAPEYPIFPITEGLTGAAIARKESVNIGNVAADPRYLTAFGSTRSEIIVPVFDERNSIVVGTIDLESGELNAFNAEVQNTLEACSQIIRPLWDSR